MKYSDNIVSASVDVTELMGAETYLFLTIDGINMTARVKPTSTAARGDIIKIAFDPEKIHIFDKETEKVITN
jgi:multiple sugar transport system ATP-binding protein